MESVLGNIYEVTLNVNLETAQKQWRELEQMEDKGEALEELQGMLEYIIMDVIGREFE